jgi:uncharacterized protein YcnI
VPNERDDAQTTMVEVTFPTDHPIAFVSVEPVPSWTIKVDKATLATPIKHDDDSAKTIGSIALGVGAIGVVLAAFALVRRRRASS